MAESTWSRRAALGTFSALAARLLIGDARASDSDSSGSTDSSYSSDGTLEASEIGLVVSTVLSVVVVVVVVVLIVRKARRRKGGGGKGGKGRKAQLPGGTWVRAPEGPSDAARTLVMATLLAEQQAVGPALRMLARSPGALDALEAEALRGEGPTLQALAEALQVSPADVAAGVRIALEMEGLPAGEEAVDALVVRIVSESVEDLVPDPGAAGRLLDRLHAEGPHLTDPARSPLHHRLAQTLDVEVGVVAAAASDTWARRDAAARDETPLLVWDELADAVEAAEPARVLARHAQAEALAVRWVPSIASAALPTP